MNKTLFTLGILVMFASMVCSEDVLSIKSDSTWKAATSVPGVDWLQPTFDDSSWGTSTGTWNHGPCSTFCGKFKSCEVGCNEWMWTSQQCTNCTSYFRKTVNIPGEITGATITVSADDYYWLYVNGVLVGTSEAKKVSYALSDNYDITQLLHNGDNVIAIKVENKMDYEGVVVRSEIRYRTTDPLISQLQSQVDILHTQVNKLTEDKTRLEGQVDSLSKEKSTLTADKDNLLRQVSSLQMENTDLKTRLGDSESELGKYRTYTISFFIAIIVLLIALFMCLYYIYEKSKKKQPTISKTPMFDRKSQQHGGVEKRHSIAEPKENVFVPPSKSSALGSLKEEGRSSGSELFR